MIFQNLQKLASEQNLTLAKLAVLEAIMEGPMRLSHVAKVAGHSTAAATGLSDSLESFGLAERKHSLGDRRAIILHPTRLGMEVFEKFSVFSQKEGRAK